LGPVEGLETAGAQLEDVVAAVRGLRDRAVADPDRLAEVEARLDAIARLKRKYGETEAAILEYRRGIAAALERIGSPGAPGAGARRPRSSSSPPIPARISARSPRSSRGASCRGRCWP